LAEATVAVAAGEEPHLTIFGVRHGSPDGSCCRDFIHVTDIATAHLAAIERAAGYLDPCEILNVGSGRTHSVLQFIETFQRVAGMRIPLVMGPARKGDTIMSCADVARSTERLGWQPTLGLVDICRNLAEVAAARANRSKSA
jgi:UDP-glucose 4-epimerase